MVKLLVYVVVATVDYIPYVLLVTRSKEDAIALAKAKSTDRDEMEWKNSGDDYGDIYFNQEEYGSMDNSTTVVESFIDIDWEADFKE